MIDPNEAPEGYVAVPEKDGSCTGCDFDDNGCCKPYGQDVSCASHARDDRQSVIFLKRKEAPANAVMTPKQVRDALFMSVMELHRLRDKFAGQAMQGLIYDPDRADQSRFECARLSYLMADAMLHAKFATMTWGKK